MNLLSASILASLVFAPSRAAGVPLGIRVTHPDLEDLEAQLELSPDSAVLLEECGLAALDEGEEDLGVWYLTLALDAAPDDEALFKRVQVELETFEYPLVAGQQAFAEYSDALFRISKACESKKLYANAVDLLLRCAGTRFERSAQERLERIYSKPKAVGALLASGISIPTESKSRRRPADIARLDAKHIEWENAYEVEGDYYTIKTNMGVEMAEDMAKAMAQINSFYRKVFNYKARGGSMRRCKINVYKSRAEFDKFEDVKPTVQGFYQPLDNEVTAYDPRQREYPGSLADLWSTLFHEASHQFTAIVWPNPIPTWLNEGTASYFEGTRIERGGRVTFNVVPDGRLRHLLRRFKAGSPTLEQLVTHFEDGSYDLDYYPYGWGLIYFLRNYEDENSQRVYLPILEDFMASYKSGGQHDVLARFVEYFVEEAKQPGVESFEDFVERFETWIEELALVHWGGEEAADVLLARARKQFADKQPEPALESLQRALRKRPGDSVILAELAGLNLKLKNKDAALYFYRELASLARSTEEAQLATADGQTADVGDVLVESLAGIAKVDRTVGKSLGAAHVKLVDATVDLVHACEEAGLERSALRYIQLSEAVVAGDRRLAELSDELGTHVDLRRFRRLALDEQLTDWRAGGAWSGGEQGLSVKARGIHFAYSRQTPPETYRFEVDLEIDDEGRVPFYGLCFGINPATDLRMFAIEPHAAAIGIVEYIDGSPEFIKEFDPAIRYDAKKVTLAVDVKPGRVELYFNGKRVGRFPGGEELKGGVGVFAQQAEIRFTRLRLKY